MLEKDMQQILLLEPELRCESITMHHMCLFSLLKGAMCWTKSGEPKNLPSIHCCKSSSSCCLQPRSKLSLSHEQTVTSNDCVFDHPSAKIILQRRSSFSDRTTETFPRLACLAAELRSGAPCRSWGPMRCSHHIMKITRSPWMTT